MKNKKTAVLFLSIILLLQLPWPAYSVTERQSAPAERRSICGRIDPERNMAYIVSDDRTFSAIDIKNPDKPLQTACLNIPDPGPVSAVQLQDGFVYLLLGNSVQAVDVTQPREPAWRSRIEIRTDQRIDGMVIDGHRLYLYDCSSIRVFSLDNPASPVFLGSFEVTAGTGGCLKDVAARNGIVYAALGAEGVHTYSFKDLNHIADIGRMPDVQGFCENIALAGEFALVRVADPDRGLSRIEVMDVSYPANPKHKGTIRNYDLNREDNRVEIYKNMLVLNDYSKRIHFIDLDSMTDNGQNWYDAMSIPVCIKVWEGKLYLLDELGRFYVVRIDSSIFERSGATGSVGATGAAGAAGAAGKAGTDAPDRSKGEKTAYITIDDGPSRSNTPVNLDTLKKYGVKATFFVLPRDKVDDIYKRIIDEGHVIGNHSYSHDYDYLYSSTDNFKKDVLKARDFISKKLDYTSTVFRFPGGTMGRSKDVIKARAEILKGLGYKYFDWDVTTADTDSNLEKYGDEEKIVNLLANNVLKNTKNRKKLIILMHDSAGKTYTAKALPKIIEGLQKQGYGFDVLTNY